MRRLPIVAALAAAVLLPSAAHAAFPGKNGKIVFTAGDGLWASVGPGDMPSPVRWRGEAWAGQPEVAPNGERAAVVVSEHAPGRQFIGLVTLGSTVQTHLRSWSRSRGHLGPMSFSPDGRRIAFTAYEHRYRPLFPATIYVMNVDGTEVRRLTQGSEPSFAPSGDRIAFQRHEGGDRYDPTFGIYSVRLDGTGEQRLRSGTSPDYSPSGDQIVFNDPLPPSTDPDCDPDPTVSLMEPDGSEAWAIWRGHHCPDSAHIARSPVFSPDGREVAFSAAGWGSGRPATNIGVIDRDGSNLRFLPFVGDAFNPSHGPPDWGPRPQATTTAQCGGDATIAGTGLPDQIFGTKARDVIQAGGGDDVIRGGTRGDRICGGPGDDTIRAHKGPDRLIGGPGDDVLRGNQGRDALFGGKGFDRCFGGQGSDVARCEQSKSL